MKYFKSFTFLFLFPLFAFAQEGTSLEEYRYMSKGYAYQQQLGLDANKAGYAIHKIYQAKNEVEIIGMYKDNQLTPQALLFVVEKGGKSHYICSPNNRASLRVNELYQIDQRNLIQQEVKQKYQEAMREYLFANLGQAKSTDVIVTTIPSTYNTPVVRHTTKVEPTSTIPQTEVLTSRGLPNSSTYIPNETSPSTTSVRKSPLNTYISSATVKVGGHLSDRTLEVFPTVTQNYVAKGKVVIKVCVDQMGQVTQAKFTQRGSTTFNRNLKEIAINSAKESRFADSQLAEQCGIISYHFK